MHTISPPTQVRSMTAHYTESTSIVIAYDQTHTHIGSDTHTGAQLAIETTDTKRYKQRRTQMHTCMIGRAATGENS